ncbi:MAG: ECF transporter S component [Oscillochloris sp.]|nr:ECF transporter S component [Oscillochloris sp.]
MATLPQESPTTINTRKIVVGGILGAIAIVLGVTRLGFIPVPNTTANATIMHVPAIIGAVLEGPVVGFLAGLIFGIFSFLQADSPLFQNPIIAILPRLLIGPVAWLAYRAVAGFNKDVAAAVAGVAGTLTNTIGVLGLAIIFGFAEAIIPQLPLIALNNMLPEVVLAAIITPLVYRAISLVRSGRTSAEDTTPRDKSSF